MALVSKNAADLILGDQVFILRTITQLTLNAEQVTAIYDDGSTQSWAPGDGVQTGDPTSDPVQG